MRTFKRSSGFTLMELMVVIAIIGVLAGVGYPSYSSYITKGKRSDAKAALALLQMAQEKYRANNPSYGTLTQININATSPDGYYTIAVPTNTSTAYSATATPLAPFTDSDCGVFAVNQTGEVVSTTQTTTTKVKECWGK